MIWEAILLAGGKPGVEFSEHQNLPSKAYIPIYDKFMGEYVLDVLRAEHSIRKIITVLPDNAPTFKGTTYAGAGKSILESMESGLKSVSSGTQMVLFVTCDIPCLSLNGLHDFIQQCEHYPPGLDYSIVARQDSELVFPGIPHTYAKLREAEFCGGGLIGIAPQYFSSLRVFVSKATKGRKNPFALAKLLGLGFIFKFLMRKLSIAQIEKRAVEILRFPAKGIISKFPEIAFNVDNSSSLSLATHFLKRHVTTSKLK